MTKEEILSEFWEPLAQQCLKISQNRWKKYLQDHKRSSIRNLIIEGMRAYLGDYFSKQSKEFPNIHEPLYPKDDRTFGYYSYQLASILGCSRQTIDNWHKEGLLKGTKVKGLSSIKKKTLSYIIFDERALSTARTIQEEKALKMRHRKKGTEESLLTINELAKILNISIYTIRRHARSKIKGDKFPKPIIRSGSWYFDREAIIKIRDMIAKNKIGWGRKKKEEEIEEEEI